MNDSPTPSPDPEIVRFGLSRAVQIHSEGFRATFPHIKLDLDLVEDENLLPQDTCLALYRTYLERLQQISQDPQVKQIWIHYYPSRAHMNLDIKDDDAGDSPQTNTTAMKDCIEATGGQLFMTSQPGQGTTLTARVPFQR